MMQTQPMFFGSFEQGMHQRLPGCVNAHDRRSSGLPNNGSSYNNASSMRHGGWGWQTRLSKQQQQQQQQQKPQRGRRDGWPKTQHKGAWTREDKQSGVPVFVSGLPNNLCNPACMEAILDQAGVDEALLNCEAWPGSPCGQATLHMATVDAANRAAKHFHGCRWDSTGAEVVARVGGGETNSFCVEKREPIADADEKQALPDAKDDSSPASDIKSHEESACKSSPALSAATTTFSWGTPSPLASPLLTAAAAGRKVSWADLASDDEDETCTGATEEESPTTETGSAGTSTSEDGF
jgi:hypothetical protein